MIPAEKRVTQHKICQTRCSENTWKQCGELLVRQALILTGFDLLSIRASTIRVTGKFCWGKLNKWLIISFLKSLLIIIWYPFRKNYIRKIRFQETIQVTYILLKHFLSSDPPLTLFPTTRFFTPSITNCDPVFMNRENIALKKKTTKLFVAKRYNGKATAIRMLFNIVLHLVSREGSASFSTCQPTWWGKTNAIADYFYIN